MGPLRSVSSYGLCVLVFQSVMDLSFQGCTDYLTEKDPWFLSEFALPDHYIRLERQSLNESSSEVVRNTLNRWCSHFTSRNKSSKSCYILDSCFVETKCQAPQPPPSSMEVVSLQGFYYMLADAKNISLNNTKESCTIRSPACTIRSPESVYDCSRRSPELSSPSPSQRSSTASEETAAGTTEAPRNNNRSSVPSRDPSCNVVSYVLVTVLLLTNVAWALLFWSGRKERQRRKSAQSPNTEDIPSQALLQVA